MSWSQTAWMYARGNGASLEQHQQAYTLGTGGDALLGIVGSFAGAGAAREGIALPGGQARPIGGTRAAELRSNLEVQVRPAARSPVPQSPATNIADAPRLRIQLTAQQIAGGHAFEKHVLGVSNPNGAEFGGLGIRTRAQFADHIEGVITNPTRSSSLTNGRNAYYDSASNTIVLTNPRASDGGTAFRPVNGEAYLRALR